MFGSDGEEVRSAGGCLFEMMNFFNCKYCYLYIDISEFLMARLEKRSVCTITLYKD
jgi:hypothetical protein